MSTQPITVSVGDLAATLIKEADFRFTGTLTRRNWLNWLPTARAYIRKGGRGHLLDLFDVEMHTVILHNLGQTDAAAVRQAGNEEFIGNMTRALLPRTMLEVIRELKSLSLGQTDSLGKYIGTFDLIVVGLAENTRPSDERMVEIFIEGIEHKTLKKLMKEVAPRTLADAYAKALENARIIQTANEVIIINGAESLENKLVEKIKNEVSVIEGAKELENKHIEKITGEISRIEKNMLSETTFWGFINLMILIIIFMMFFIFINENKNK